MHDQALARTGDLFTSHSAAERVNVTELQAVVLAALAAAPGGLTSHEIAARTGRDLVSISPRMRPLVEKGKVREGGVRERRTIWIAV
jgi:DNA-binding MarR family transcriptional regulator